jgi:hypothetical protein
VDGLLAVALQPLSPAHSGSRQENWLADQPNEPSMACAIGWGDPDAVGTLLAAGCWPERCWPERCWPERCWPERCWPGACCAASRAASRFAVSSA